MKKIWSKKPGMFKRLNAPYRMVFINEETLEEVGSFHLTKNSVYALFSTLFVVTIVATVIILLYTPLRYYIPGYGSQQNRQQVLRLQQQVDSLGDYLLAQQRQTEAIKKIIAGNDAGLRDTIMLSPQQIERMRQESILPQGEEIKEVTEQALPKSRSRKK